MNSDQVKSLIRAVLVMICGGGVGVWLVKHGITIDDNFLTMATSIIAGGVGVAWSQFITHAKPAA